MMWDWGGFVDSAYAWRAHQFFRGVKVLCREAKGLESFGVGIGGGWDGGPLEGWDAGILGSWEVAPAVARINCRGLAAASTGVLTMADVFVSYARSDKARVAPLVAAAASPGPR